MRLPLDILGRQLAGMTDFRVAVELLRLCTDVSELMPRRRAGLAQEVTDVEFHCGFADVKQPRDFLFERPSRTACSTRPSAGVKGRPTGISVRGAEPSLDSSPIARAMRFRDAQTFPASTDRIAAISVGGSTFVGRTPLAPALRHGRA